MIGYFILTATLSIIWTIPLLLFQIFKLHLFKVSKPQETILLIKNLKGRSSVSEDGQPRGWIYGYGYLGYVHEDSISSGNSSSRQNIIYILCKKSYFEHLMNANKTKDLASISIYERQGNYFNFNYSQRNLVVEKYNPREDQEEVLGTIIDKYNKNNYTVIFLHGNPGSGKSMIGVLLTKKLNGSLCRSFNPTEPGDTLVLLYNSVAPTKENPLIVVLEEANILINDVHKGIVPHRHIPTSVRNKTGFNMFLDDIDLGLYPYLILIMTSNASPNYIDSLDSSYLREGRVNLRLHLTSK